VQPRSTALALTCDVHQKIDYFLASKQLDGIAMSTINGYRYRLNIFASWVPVDVDKITIIDLRKFLTGYALEKNLKACTLNLYQATLRTFFGWLEDEDYVVKSPAKKLKDMKTEKRTRKHLSIKELEVLRTDGCKTIRDRAILEMFFSTGGRVSEIAQINIDKINWTDNSIQIIGKGNKERTIYFSEKAKVHIVKYLAERGIQSNQALFVAGKIPHGRLSVKSLRNEIHEMGVRAGFERNIFPHLLRHTMATLGYKAGIPLPIIQELLGHTDASTTQQYAVLDQGVLQAEYKKHMNQ